MDQSTTIMWVLLVGTVAALLAASRVLKPFFWRFVWAVLPLAIGAMIVVNAWGKYQRGHGGSAMVVRPDR